ncbi:hypothetical protein JI744_15075 [Tabrizicola sp. KVB23]|uniref:Uncharacterized protein n=2 Tax=Fuscibacter oryzae TaxID=2803939 RepID=A0A8J7MSS1_9RHOB|nr:hypothetical protein [Fuscibacter oryzae]
MKPNLTDAELSRLKQLGDILMPAGGSKPAFSTVPEIDRLLQVAAGASGASQESLTKSISDLPDFSDLAGVKIYAECVPANFALLSRMISGAYYMARDVLLALNYPLERRNPAGVSDFADEYMTGILDPVMENNRGAP